MDTYKLINQIITFHKKSRMLAREENLNEVQLSTLIKINVDNKIDISYSFNENDDTVYFNSHYLSGDIDKMELEKQFKKNQGPFDAMIANDEWIELLGKTKKEELTIELLNSAITYLLNSELIKMIIRAKWVIIFIALTWLEKQNELQRTI